MRLRNFYRDLRSVKKTANNAYVNPLGAIRIYYDCKCYCPLTAVVKNKTQRIVGMYYFRDAAKLLTLENEATNIAKAADCDDDLLTPRQKRIRHAILRALGLGA
jgi:hypothetical protein